jgi:hypothetical protein
VFRIAGVLLALASIPVGRYADAAMQLAALVVILVSMLLLESRNTRLKPPLAESSTSA